MSYKVNNTIRIKDDNNVVFKDIIATTRQTFAPSYTYRGASTGYYAGGFISPPGVPTNIIDKFPFSVDANATDVGNLTEARDVSSGHSSDTHGYASGGSAPPLSPPIRSTIDKFSFSSDGNATDVGDLELIVRYAASHSSQNDGYTSGGGGPFSVVANYTAIQKFPFATDGDGSNVADISQENITAAGQSAGFAGYISAGKSSGPGPGAVGFNTIEKFPFFSDTDATDVGDLTQIRFGTLGGQSSSTHGYASGGRLPPFSSVVNTIDKFPFSADANATDVGDLTQARVSCGGTSSNVSGYTAGGYPGSLPYANIIDKFSFSSDGNATDVGDLTATRSVSDNGQQV